MSSKRTIPGPSSSSSTRPSSSMATFFPDRIQPRHSHSQHANGHSQRAHPSASSSSSTSSHKSNGHGSTGPLESNGSSVSKAPSSDNKHSTHRKPTPTNGTSDASKSKYRSFQITYDPELSKSKSKGSRPIYRYNGADAPTPTDPRIEGQKRYTRTSRGKKGLTSALPIPIFPVCLIY